MRFRSKFRGCLLGLTVADAVGTTLEFKPKGSFQPISDMVGGGPFGLKPGQFTDDGSMALCLAASLIERQRFDPNDQMRKYLMWRDTGYMSSNGRCFDIGGTVSQALSGYRRSGNPFSGPTDRHSAGNGALMRLAPVPMAYAYDPLRAGWLSSEMSRTTHGAPQSLDACRFYGQLLSSVLNGISNVHAWSESLLSFRQYDPEVVEAIQGAWSKPYSEIRGTGYVIKALEAALWCFYHSSSLEEGGLKAANLGDDADTTAAIYGQLAGAYYGVQGIPQKWLDKLAMRIETTLLADALYDYCLEKEGKQ